jgi:hypothetical protein
MPINLYAPLHVVKAKISNNYVAGKQLICRTIYAIKPILALKYHDIADSKIP